MAITSVARAATIKAMSNCLEQIKFGDAIFLSDRPVEDTGHPEIRWIPIDPIRSRSEYSTFLLKHLMKHIDTEFVLCVQWDGYVLDARKWLPEFLDYDYIGAPWPQFDDGRAVGNGGFSLRSKQLLQAIADVQSIEGQAEDIAICRTNREWLEQERSIRFAPVELAAAFAYERRAPTGREFGFHGVFNMAEFLGRMEFRSILSSLEPKLLARRERRDLLKLAVKRLDFRLLRILLQ